MKKLLLIALVLIAVPLVSAASLDVSFSKTTVQPGEAVTITYSQASGDSYGIIQRLPTGWTAADLSPDGNYRTYVDDGSTHVFVVMAPSYSVTSTFEGEYFVYPSTSYTSFTDVTVTVGEGGSEPNPDPDPEEPFPMMYVYIGLGLLLFIWFLKQT